MTTCCFCGFESKSRAVFVEMEDGRTRCKSGAACMRRLSSGKHLKRRVRLELEVDSPLDEDTLAALANIKEADRAVREIRHVYYAYGLCVDCGAVPRAVGRPRCQACHIKRR